MASVSVAAVWSFLAPSATRAVSAGSIFHSKSDFSTESLISKMPLPSGSGMMFSDLMRMLLSHTNSYMRSLLCTGRKILISSLCSSNGKALKFMSSCTSVASILYVTSAIVFSRSGSSGSGGNHSVLRVSASPYVLSASTTRKNSFFSLLSVSLPLRTASVGNAPTTSFQTSSCNDVIRVLSAGNFSSATPRGRKIM